MKLGTATSVLYQYDLYDAIQLIAKLGFDGVDIWGGRPHVYRQDYSAAELTALRKMIDDSGIETFSFMPAFYHYPHSLSNPNSIVRQDSIDYMRFCIDNAAILGAKVVLVVPDHSLFGQSREASLQRFTESLGRIAVYASKYDLMLGIEVLYLDETDFVNSSEDALSIIREVNCNNIGVVLDTGTLNLSKENIEESVTKLNHLLLQIHINDNDGRGKQQNLIPGEGTYNFKQLISTLQKCGYDGYLSAELSKSYSDNPSPALELTANRMRSWMR